MSKANKKHGFSSINFNTRACSTLVGAFALFALFTQSSTAATLHYGSGTFNVVIGNPLNAGESASIGGVGANMGDPLPDDNPHASGNVLYITGGDVFNSIAGGYHGTAQDIDVNAHNNVVTITSSFVGNTNILVMGGHAQASHADSAKTVAATGNQLNIQGGTIQRAGGGSAIAESAAAAIAHHNAVSMTGGQVVALTGGYAVTRSTGIPGATPDRRASAMYNTVSVSGGTVGFFIAGGFAEAADINEATYNTVIIQGNPNLSSAHIYGGISNYSIGDYFSGNRLSFQTAGQTALNLGNFQYLDFYLPSTFQNGQTVLTVTNNANLTDGAARSSTVSMGLAGRAPALKVGDRIVLLDAANLIGTPENTQSTAMQGVTVRYDFEILTQGNQLIALVSTAQAAPEAKVLSEGYLAGAMLVARGADSVAYDALNAISIQNQQQGLEPFVLLSGSHNRYNSGSHIKSNDALLMGGVSYQYKPLTAAAFLETGWGSYDTYNSFYNAASIKGDGHTRYYGVGVLGRYDFENAFYTDASLRVGRSHNQFDASDLQNTMTGDKANYKLSSRYVSAHMGVGYVVPWSERNVLDFSTKYLWTHLSGKQVDVVGVPVRFDSVDSKRIRLDAQLNHLYSKNLTFTAGVGYEYEFDGKAKATTMGIHKVDAPSMKGSTGIFSLGTIMTPRSNQNLNLDMKLQGYTGKREGVGGMVKVSYAF